ncbi:MAG: very short patch repair endonuclease, partial [Flavobacteriaceae bacterium]|nr:very short patch repair endonuclease [Flavobacteriaceae bacterium]
MSSSKSYKRDHRSPMPLNEARSKIMSSIKGKNTKPELLLRKELWSEGIRGYRLHWKKAPGRPDIAFVNRKIAIFVNGCFWHRCPKCNHSLPKHNSSYWKDKFQKNVERDKAKTIQLNEADWKVITIWECE